MVLSRGWLYYALYIASVNIAIIILIVINGRLASRIIVATIYLV